MINLRQKLWQLWDEDSMAREVFEAASIARNNGLTILPIGESARRLRVRYMLYRQIWVGR